MEWFSGMLPRKPLRIADVGSYDVNGTYKPIFAPVPDWEYSGLDVSAGPNVDIVLASQYDLSNVPDASFDVVVSGQTVEHVRQPWKLVAEMARIVRPGALLCVIAPYAWEYHTFPIDCWRLYSDGMRGLLEGAGLHVLSAHMTEFTPAPHLRGDTVGIAIRPVLNSSI
jgi:SAM-dependent methyltransferase